MESKWRYNIPYLGMSGTDWHLCARSLEDPDLVLVSRPSAPPFEYSIWFAPGPDSDPVRLTPWRPIAGNFPFGAEVEPD